MTALMHSEPFGERNLSNTVQCGSVNSTEEDWMLEIGRDGR